MTQYQAPIQNTKVKKYATKDQFVNVKQQANWWKYKQPSSVTAYVFYVAFKNVSTMCLYSWILKQQCIT